GWKSWRPRFRPGTPSSSAFSRISPNERPTRQSGPSDVDLPSPFQQQRHHSKRENLMTTSETKTLPLLSLRNLVLFPGAVMPVEIGRPSSLRLIDALGGKGAHVLVGTQKDAYILVSLGADLYSTC